MGSRTVVIATTPDGGARQAQNLLNAVSESWSSRVRIDTIPITPPPAPKDLLRVSGILALLERRPPMGELLTFLDAAEQAGVPVLVLLGDEAARGPENGTFAGAMAMPATTPPATICAALEGLMHASADARRLRADLSLAHRASGGLEGEIVKMHEELQLAAMVQRELLPRETPEVHGVSFGSLWRPANYVSGDIFDIARLDEDRVGIFLADSVGHGVPAALMTMVISRALVMKEVEGESCRILPPSEVLTRLNNELRLRQGNTTRFATGVAAVINCRSRIMHLAGAGHPAPMLMRGKDEIIELDCGEGGLLGIFDDETYDQVEIELQVDDRVIFYSDGFEQAFPAESNDPYERLLPTATYRSEFEQLARQNTTASLIEQLRKRLDAQQGSLHQADDLTLVCMYAGAIDGGCAQDNAHTARTAA